MDLSDEPADVVVTKARPKFFARTKDDLYWISDASSRIVIVLADRQAAVDLMEQLIQVLRSSTSSDPS